MKRALVLACVLVLVLSAAAMASMPEKDVFPVNVDIASHAEISLPESLDFTINFLTTPRYAAKGILELKANTAVSVRFDSEGFDTEDLNKWITYTLEQDVALTPYPPTLNPGGTQTIRLGYTGKIRTINFAVSYEIPEDWYTVEKGKYPDVITVTVAEPV